MSPMKKGMLPIFLILAALFADIAIAFPAGQTFFHVPPPHVQVPVAQQAVACQTIAWTSHKTTESTEDTEKIKVQDSCKPVGATSVAHSNKRRLKSPPQVLTPLVPAVEQES